MITMELEKPDKASSGVRMLKINNPTRAHSATMSERNLPLIKNIAESVSMQRVTNIVRINSCTSKIRRIFHTSATLLLFLWYVDYFFCLFPLNCCNIFLWNLSLAFIAANTFFAGMARHIFL